MGRFLKITVLSLLFLSLGAVYVQAQENAQWPFRQNEKVTLEENETVERDFFATGESIEIKGTVNGDLYAAGGNIVIEGTVNGDVLAAGGQIEIPGKVGGSVRVAGGNIEINGVVGKNLTAGAGNIEVGKEASISGSMVFGAGNVEVNGPVGGNIVAGVGNLVVRNSVSGGIYTGVGKLQIDEGAKITGDVTYWSDEEALVDEAATISGTLERRTPVEPRGPSDKDVESFLTGFRLFSLLSMVVIGLLLLRFFPGILETGVQILDQKPWQSLGLGLVKLILEPIVAIILIVTVIGLPLGIFLIFAYIMEIYFASYFVTFWIGKLVMNRFNQKANLYWSFIVGVLVFALITSVPIVSGIVRFLSLLFGLGAILLLKYSWYQRFFGKKK